MTLKFLYKIICFFTIFPLISCTTTEPTRCHCPPIKQAWQKGSLSESTSDDTNQNLSSAQMFTLASNLFNSGELEEALKILDTFPEHSKDNQYKTLRHDIINKIVINMRYKVRTLYEKSLQQEGNNKRDLLIQCKSILEATIKNYSDYENMYAIKNNLKQIERELTKK